MSKEPSGPTRRKRMRRLSEDEQRLWQQAMRDASPLRLRHRRGASAPDDLPDAGSKDASAAATSGLIEKSKKPDPLTHSGPLSVPAEAAPPARPKQSLPPPLTGLDRRTSQRLGRGQVEFEAKLDLHGHSREQAYGVLRDFLSRAHHDGLRCVLVVTGKGENPFARHTLHGTRHYDVPERQGVLRANLPLWLAEPELRRLVSGFQPAHPRHGGGGAFYVLLRRRR